MPSTYTYPRSVYGNLQRPYRLVSSNGKILPESSTVPAIQELRDIIFNEVFGNVRELLPEGCPAMLGGGFVRDALFGACPTDLDIWLPSNFSLGAEAFVEYLIDQRFYQREDIRILFRGPWSPVETNPMNLTYPVPYGPREGEPDPHYGDVNNHWVIEIAGDGGAPPINYMCTMVQWDNNPQGYCDVLMRSFDFDLCMYFLAILPGQTEFTHVIVPNHKLPAHQRPFPSAVEGTVGGVRISQVYLNRTRAMTTSTVRLEARLAKLLNKYNFQPSNMSSFDRAQNQLFQHEIRAVSIPIRLASSIYQNAPRVRLVPRTQVVSRWEIHL